MTSKQSALRARQINIALQVHREFARMALAGEADMEGARAELARSIRHYRGICCTAMNLLYDWERILRTQDWNAMLEESSEGNRLRAMSPVDRLVPSKVRWLLQRTKDLPEQKPEADPSSITSSP